MYILYKKRARNHPPRPESLLHFAPEYGVDPVCVRHPRRMHNGVNIRTHLHKPPLTLQNRTSARIPDLIFGPAMSGFASSGLHSHPHDVSGRRFFSIQLFSKIPNPVPNVKLASIPALRFSTTEQSRTRTIPPSCTLSMRIPLSALF